MTQPPPEGVPVPEPDPMPTPETRWADRLALGEGGRWVDGRLILVDILTGRLLEDTGGESLAVLADLPVPLGAVAPVEGAAGTWIAAAGTGICLLRGSQNAPSTSAIDWLARPEDDAPTPMRMNDAVADPTGRLWAGSMAYNEAGGAGSLFRVDGDGTTSRVLSGITIPNGPAFTPDGTTMYLADSSRRVVHRYPVDPLLGSLGEPELFADFAELGGTDGIDPADGDYGLPDGMTVDSEGGLWIAFWGGGAVRRFRPDGTLDRELRVPAKQPTSVCLGGEDGRTLFVTSAAVGLDSAGADTDTGPGANEGAVFTTRVEIPGAPAAYFRPTGALAATLAEQQDAVDPGPDR